MRQLPAPAHGHSHRSGAATRYWREPRAVCATVMMFVVLVMYAMGSNNKHYHQIPPTHDNNQHSNIVTWWIEPGFEPAINFLGKRDDNIVMEIMPDFQSTCSYIEAFLMDNIQVDAFICRTPKCIYAFAPLNRTLIIWMTPETENALVAFDMQWTRALASREHTFVVFDTTTKKTPDPMWRQLTPILPPASQLRKFFLTISQLKLQQCRAFPSTFTPLPLHLIQTECPLQQHSVIPRGTLCDKYCHEHHLGVFRADLGGCVSGGVCSLLTSTACNEPTFAKTCARDCETTGFARIAHLNKIIWDVYNASIACMFGLGIMLGLIFARVNWVDPLLAQLEELRPHHHEHGHEHDEHG